AAGDGLEELARVLRRHEHTPGAGLERLCGVAAAVRLLAAQADEQLAGPDRARIDRHTVRTRTGVSSGWRRQEARSGCASEALRAPTSPRLPAPATLCSRAPSASLATATSSKGTLRPSASS